MTEEMIELSRCAACQTWFLPTDGPCPHCGSAEKLLVRAPGLGTVLSSTELMHPSSGWASPHRLALVELPQAVRLLAVVDGDLPREGSLVTIRYEGEVYRVRLESGASGRRERGEGESPRAGASEPPFEPPR